MIVDCYVLQDYIIKLLKIQEIVEGLLKKETKKLGKHYACPICKDTIKMAEEEPVAELENAGK